MNKKNLISAALFDLTEDKDSDLFSVSRRYKSEVEMYKNEVFSFAGNLEKIQGQEIGSIGKIISTELDRDYIVRTVKVVDSTTGEQKNDDWIRFYFKENLEHIPLGMKFWFKDNVWLSYNVSNNTNIVPNCIAHRCTMLLRKRCQQGDKVYSEPCFMTRYQTIQNRIYQTDANNIINPENAIIVQMNEFTKSIKVNDRFIFGENETAQAWRIKTILPFFREKTYDKNSCNLVALTAERTEIKATDDLENGIADNDDYFEIKVDEQPATDADDNAYNIQIHIEGGSFAINQYDSKIITAAVTQNKYGHSSIVENASIVECDYSFSNVPQNRFRAEMTNDTDCKIYCLAPHSAPLYVSAKGKAIVGGEEKEFEVSTQINLCGNI